MTLPLLVRPLCHTQDFNPRVRISTIVRTGLTEKTEDLGSALTFL